MASKTTNRIHWDLHCSCFAVCVTSHSKPQVTVIEKRSIPQHWLYIYSFSFVMYIQHCINIQSYHIVFGQMISLSLSSVGCNIVLIFRVMLCCFAKLHIFCRFSAMPLYFNTDNRERGVFVDRWWWDMMARAKTSGFSCSFLIRMSRVYVRTMSMNAPQMSERTGLGRYLGGLSPSPRLKVLLHLHVQPLIELSWWHRRRILNTSHSPSVLQTSLNKLILCSTKKLSNTLKNNQNWNKKKTKQTTTIENK